MQLQVLAMPVASAMGNTLVGHSVVYYNTLKGEVSKVQLKAAIVSIWIVAMESSRARSPPDSYRKPHYPFPVDLDIFLDRVLEPRWVKVAAS